MHAEGTWLLMVLDTNQFVKIDFVEVHLYFKISR
jgi:hypothetical protein